MILAPRSEMHPVPPQVSKPHLTHKLVEVGDTKTITSPLYHITLPDHNTRLRHTKHPSRPRLRWRRILTVLVSTWYPPIIRPVNIDTRTASASLESPLLPTRNCSNNSSSKMQFMEEDLVALHTVEPTLTAYCQISACHWTDWMACSSTCPSMLLPVRATIPYELDYLNQANLLDLLTFRGRQSYRDANMHRSETSVFFVRTIVQAERRARIEWSGHLSESSQRRQSQETISRNTQMLSSHFCYT